MKLPPKVKIPKKYNLRAQLKANELVGAFIVTVDKAKDLYPSDGVFGSKTNDPFCQIYLSSQKEYIKGKKNNYKTETLNNTKNPEWK